ncbi:MAG: selenocysteine-specific translation elongation factor [Deltaproteobacteria bacterium]|nr:selenocysteine-specific translation elongation factor [Deltaproteobacteria bacterium]
MGFVGIAGHVDHGKTSLVRCLTGVDTDRLREEKERGISIESGIAPCVLPSGRKIAFVDVPGHKNFFKNTIRGLTMTDIAVLVIAADDSVMPQTKEHLEILKFAGCEGGVVVLSKADLVDREILGMAVEEVRELVRGSFLEGRPVIPFSAVDGQGKEAVLNALEEECKDACGKDPNAPFRMYIDQLQGIKGYGTVVSGTILSGKIGTEDMIEIYPTSRKTKVRYLQVHHQKVDMAYAGQRVGINLPNVKLNEIKRGMVLADTGMLRASYLINGCFHYLSDQKRPLKNRTRVRFYTGTAASNALMVFMEQDVLKPGQQAMVHSGCWTRLHHFSLMRYSELKEMMLQVLEKTHQANPLKSYISKKEIRERLAQGLHPCVFDEILKELQLKGKIVVESESVRLPGFVPRPSSEQQQIIEDMLNFAEHTGYAPFSVDRFWQAYKRIYDREEIRKLALFLCSQNQLTRLNNGRFISPKKMDKIKEKIRKHIVEKGSLTLHDSKEILGFGRTGGVPVLEHLDTIGFTMRTGDVRVLKKR